MGAESGLPDLVAIHRDAASARHTIERLSRAGVDGGDIEVLGDLEVVTAGRYADRQIDLNSSLALGARALRGALWGAPIGALVGTLLLAFVSRSFGLVIVGGAVGGVLFGTAVGVLGSLLSVPTMASSWERTFAPRVPGGVAIGIRVDGPRTQRRARRALAGCDAQAVEAVPDLDDVGDRFGGPDLSR